MEELNEKLAMKDLNRRLAESNDYVVFVYEIINYIQTVEKVPKVYGVFHGLSKAEIWVKYRKDTEVTNSLQI